MLLTITKPATPPQQDRVPERPDVDQETLRSAAVQAIRRDCLLEPSQYLDEVRVPFGGE